MCKVGCQTVVFNTVSDLARNIEAYYKNPDAVEKEFIAEAVNKMDEGPRAVCDEASFSVGEACPPPRISELRETANPVVRR